MNEEARARHLMGEVLTPAEQAELADESADLDELRRLLADPRLWDEPPSSLEDDVVAAVRAEVAQAGPSAATNPRAEVIPLATARRRSLRLALLSAAAAAAVAVGATAVVLRDRAPAGPPNQVEVALPDGRPGSVEIADTASGLRIHLDAPDLERLGPGRFYQGWLRSADGQRLVTIGTFHAGSDVTLWAGVPLAEFPTLTVTVEPDDGNPASSGNKVLVVPLVRS